MNLIIGLIMLFVYLGPLYVGFITLEAFLSKKGKKSLFERTAICREPKFLAICIALLLLIPGELIYTTLTHVIPSGEYPLAVDYSVYGISEEYDDVEDVYYEKEYSYKGTATANISIDNQVEYEDNGYDYLGQERTKTIHYTNVYLSSIKLDCFNNKTFYIDYEINSNDDYEFEIEYNDISYTLRISVGDVSDETLGYTLEDRINGVSTRDIVEHSILMLLDIVGIIGFFKALKIEKREDIEVDE